MAREVEAGPAACRGPPRAAAGRRAPREVPRAAGVVRHTGGMAERTIVTITDDLDGSEGAETVQFSFKDTVWSVDLSSRNQQKLLRALEPFISAGTVVSRPPARLPR